MAAVTYRLRTRVGRELRLTYRMMRHNFIYCVVVPTGFGLSAALYYDLPVEAACVRLAGVAVLSFWYTYLFDAFNQARAEDEDRLNKPRRPIPSGMATSAQLRRRFWIAVPVYLAIGWQLDVLAAVLAWPIALILYGLVAQPRHYAWTKPLLNAAGSLPFFVPAWQIVGPLDPVAWRWIIVTGVVLNATTGGSKISVTWKGMRASAADPCP